MFMKPTVIFNERDAIREPDKSSKKQVRRILNNSPKFFWIRVKVWVGVIVKLGLVLGV